MLSSNHELKLLEVNTNPAMSLDNSTLERILPKVIDGTIQLVLDIQVAFYKYPASDSNYMLMN